MKETFNSGGRGCSDSYFKQVQKSESILQFLKLKINGLFYSNIHEENF